MKDWAVALGVAWAWAIATGCKDHDDSAILREQLRKAAAQRAPVEDKPTRVEINPRLLRRFEPLRTLLETPGNPLTKPKTALGKLLFFDKRLSKNQDISCNTCHKLDDFGADHQKTSAGHRARRGTRNSPTVYNAAGFFAQFWDGRAATVEQQVTGPLLNPVEMALPNGAFAVRVLKSIPGYGTAFAEAFPGQPEPVTLDHVGEAIGAFERGLTTPARWDDYLRGNAGALSARELEGLKVFTNVGCMVCHTGEFLGGSMYQKVGVVQPWPNQTDQGRFEVSKQDVDRMMFKVPSLRNVSQTAPYFHDGSAPTLEAAVKAMGRHQLGLELSEDEVSAIVAWLGSLTGRLPGAYISPPALPPSSDATPKPDPT